MSEEGDEESFVILGTSPTDSNVPSLYSRSNLSSLRSEKSLALLDSESFIKSVEYTKMYDEKDNISMCSNNNTTKNLKMPSFNAINSDLTISKSSQENALSNDDSTQNISAAEGSLAASFLMGDIQLDVIKGAMHSQFPSLCNSSVKSEEILNLHHLLTEYIVLKDTLQKNNVAMRKHFTTIQKWQDEVRAQKEQQSKQINEFQDMVAKLRNENIDLRRELESKIEQIKINEDVIRKDGEETIKILSDKTAQIQNMATQIEKLEQQHLESFEFIKKLKNENEEEHQNTRFIEHEYVPISEHKRIVNDLEQRLSESFAKNLELQNMEDKYLSEINILKDKFTACEEELHKTQSDVDLLKSNDENRNINFASYEKERDTMRNEITILRTQVEVYSKDFEMERNARQNIAGEKEKILSELRLLQKKNHELIQNSRKHFETIRSDMAQSSSPRNSPQRNVVPNQEVEEQICTISSFICPICSKRYRLLKELEVHVQECIENQN